MFLCSGVATRMASQVIFTDADQAAMSAIVRVFPGTLNKLCFWHTLQNVRSHGKGLGKDVLAKVIRLFKAAAYALTEQVRGVALPRYNVYATCIPNKFGKYSPR